MEKWSELIARWTWLAGFGGCDRLGCAVAGEGEGPGAWLGDVQQERVLGVGDDDRAGLVVVAAGSRDGQGDGWLAVVGGDGPGGAAYVGRGQQRGQVAGRAAEVDQACDVGGGG